MGTACSTHGKDEKCIQHFSRNPEGNKPSEMPKCRWEDGIKTGLAEINWVRVG